MSNPAIRDDSPLSLAANIAGILTFVAALLAAAYVRLTYLRGSDQEYFRVKTSLAWYKTESDWLARLVETTTTSGGGDDRPEYQVYDFVRDDLLRLEERILELVDTVEEKAGGGGNDHPQGKRWAVIPQNWRFTTAVAVAWLPIRAQALELVRQREALAARVSFTQSSMIASRIRDLERRSELRADQVKTSLRNFEAIVEDQRAEIYRLEDLLYRVMHKDHIRDRGAAPPASSRAITRGSRKSRQRSVSTSSSYRRRAMSQ